MSKLFDVTENSQLTDMYEHKPIRIPFGKGIVGYVAESGETVNIPDAYQVNCPNMSHGTKLNAYQLSV